MNTITQQIQDIHRNIPLLQKKLKPICEKHNLNTDDLISEMLKFLNLIHVHKTALSPSLLVDLAWHEFILFTRYYDEFCQSNFNRFIHHTPSESGHPDLFIKTVNLYIKTYGAPHEAIWGSKAKEEFDSSNCGACLN